MLTQNRFFNWRSLSVRQLMFLCTVLLVSKSVFAENHHHYSIDNVTASNEVSRVYDSESGITSLQLTKNGDTLTFELTENQQLLSQNFKQQRRSSSTEFVMYRGTIVGIDNSWARFNSHNGELSGAYFDGNHLFIVSQRDALPQASNDIRERIYEENGGLAIFNADDIKHEMSCGTTHAHEHTESFDYQTFVDDLNLATARVADRQVLISLAADFEFVQTSAIDPVDEMLAEMNIVDGIFSEQMGIRITVDQTRELADGDISSTTDAEGLIVSYRTYVATQYDNPGLSHLFSGRDMDSNVIGIAYVGGVCHPFNFGIGLTQRFGANTALVAAHEIGHNFGAPHDNQGGSACLSTAGTFLMNPSINGSSTFSDCSIAQMDNVVANVGSCLIDLDILAPTITSVANTIVELGDDYSYDQDDTLEADGSGEITFNLDFGPDGMTVTPEGVVAWTPTSEQVGSHPVQISASNDSGDDVQNFDVEVMGDYINLKSYTFSSYGGNQDKDGTSIVSDNGLQLSLTGNRWVKIDFPYTVTRNTTIEFDFSSSVEGEIHGLGLDSDDSISSARTFNVFGSQSWGNQTYAYNGGGETQTIKIPVGQYYSGNMDYLFFVMDDDTQRDFANGVFSNIKIYEAETEPNAALLINFNEFNVTDYTTNQSVIGDHQVLDDGSTIHLSGNIWRKIEIDTVLTASSVLEFEYASSSMGEIHAIGFANQNKASFSDTFKLEGTQNYGVKTFQYSGNGSFQKFAIPVGQFVQGEYLYMTFILDNDVDAPMSEGIFKNITLK